MAGSSVAWKLVKRNSVQPEQKKMMQLLGDYKKESRAYVLNPKFASPTSLPLYFYFGYQLLQESNLLMRSGRVRNEINTLLSSHEPEAQVRYSDHFLFGVNLSVRSKTYNILDLFRTRGPNLGKLVTMHACVKRINLVK